MKIFGESIAIPAILLYNACRAKMTACADAWEGLEGPRETKTGHKRDFIGFVPPIGGLTKNGTDNGDPKIAVIAVADQGQRNQAIRSYSQKGYSCVSCETNDDWAMKSNLFFDRQNATLVTDDLDLIWQVRLHDLTEGTSVLVHALVQTNELLVEAHALQLGVSEIFESLSETESVSIKDLF